MNKDKVIAWIISEAQKHHIACDFPKECDSKCGECAIFDIMSDPKVEKIAVISDDQSLPVLIALPSRAAEYFGSEIAEFRVAGYKQGQQDMIEAGWKRVEKCV